MKKFIIAFAAAMVLSVPAFALDYFGSDGFQLQRMNGDTPWYLITYNETDQFKPVYYYRVATDPQYNPGYYVYAISEFSNAQFSTTGSNVDPNAVSYFNCNTAFGQYYIYGPMGQFSSSNYTIPNLVEFSYNTSDVDIQNAFSAYLSGAQLKTFTATFTVPRGNVLYFKVPSDGQVSFASTMSYESSILHSDFSPWGDTGQRISVEADLPGPGVYFPKQGSGPIEWEKVPPYNVLGQTKVGSYTDTFNAGQYYSFYNPSYAKYDPDGVSSPSTIGATVTVSGTFNFARVFPLSQLLDQSTSDDNYETWFDAEGDDNGGVTWVDQDDQVNTPSSGGQNSTDQPISSNSLIESIKNILKNILSEIENIFTFGFSAIHNLVELMDDFVSTFDDLYEWLPEPVYTLLISAIIVAITIGVFKVFL